MSHFQRYRGSGPPSGARRVGRGENLATGSPSSFAPWTGAFVIQTRAGARTKALGVRGRRRWVIETSGMPLLLGTQFCFGTGEEAGPRDGE